MIQSDRKLLIFVVLGCIIMALLGFAWKQRTSIPFVTVPLKKLLPHSHMVQLAYFQQFKPAYVSLIMLYRVLLKAMIRIIPLQIYNKRY